MNVYYFNIELSDSELLDLFENGSTNQKQLAKDIIKYNVYDEFFSILEEIQEFNKFDIRGAINGGVLKIVEVDNEEENQPENLHLKDNIYLYLE